MTRRQILRQGIQWSRRPASDPAIEDIPSLSAFLDSVVLDWTSPYRTLPLVRQTGFTSGSSAAYCIDGLHWIDSASIQKEDGTTIPIRVINSSDADAILGPSWRHDTGTGQPIAFVTDGPASGRLYPIPSYTDADGLTLYGRGALTASMWSGLDAECPLQGQHHLGLAACLTDHILKDCDEWVPPGRLATYDQMARRAKATFIIEAGQLNASDSHRNIPASVSAGGGFSPFTSP